MSNEDKRYPTWRWIAITAIGLVGTLALIGYADVQKKIDGKADKEIVEQLCGDVRDIRAMMVSHIMQTGAGTVPPKEYK